MKCQNCHVKPARARDLFCSNRCGHAYALELLATDDSKVCPRCRDLVSVSSWAAEDCPLCGADIGEAPTAAERVSPGAKA